MPNLFHGVKARAPGLMVQALVMLLASPSDFQRFRVVVVVSLDTFTPPTYLAPPAFNLSGLERIVQCCLSPVFLGIPLAPSLHNLRVPTISDVTTAE